MYDKNELKELFQKLFYNYDEIIIHKFSQGLSGTKIVKVVSLKGTTIGTPVLVKYGEKEKIKAEVNNFNKYVDGSMGDFKCSNIVRDCYTENLGGIIYTLINAPFTQGPSKGVIDFYDYYHITPDPKDIINVIEEIFMVIFNSWYKSPKPMAKSLYEEYDKYLNIDRSTLATKIFGGKTDTERINFHNTFMQNPVEYIQNPRNPTDYFSFCRTHGDLHCGNILIDNSTKHPWIIDFGRTGMGHILRDFTELEISIKVGGINTRLNTKNEKDFFNFEQALYPYGRFTVIEKIDFKGDNEFKKAFDVIRGLRQIAVRLAGGACKDSEEYYIGLLYNTLKILSIKDIKIDKKYALKSAAMICDKLK